MKKIKLGFIGLGQRGKGLLCNVASNFSDSVEIIGVFDSYPDRTKRGIELAQEYGKQTPKGYSTVEELLNDSEIEMVIISAAWEAHVPLAVKSMKAGKITALEVGGAYALEDCWELVHTYEQTKTPFVFLENWN